jgi:hypothetical protein
MRHVFFKGNTIKPGSSKEMKEGKRKLLIGSLMQLRYQRMVKYLMTPNTITKKKKNGRRTFKLNRMNRSLERNLIRQEAHSK